MKLSIITPVLNSHEIVRRQAMHYEKMWLPSDSVEVIYIDDGSHPAITVSTHMKQFYVYPTNNFKPWTEHIARNTGARIARGDYLMMVDVDYIIPLDVIEKVVSFSGDRMHFRRRFGTLDRLGNIDASDDTLTEYGLKSRWIRKQYIQGHRSQFVMRKDLFWKLGGYNEELDGQWRRTGGAGEKFWRKWQRAEANGKVKLHHEQPTIYMFPCDRFCENNKCNRSDLFHGLNRA